MHNASKIEPISDEELKVILKRVVWDYNISPDDLLAIFRGERVEGAISLSNLHAKLLNGYQWHQLIQWFGFEKALSFLNEDVIHKIFPKSYREKLLNARGILQA